MTGPELKEAVVRVYKLTRQHRRQFAKSLNIEWSMYRKLEKDCCELRR